MVVAGLMGAGTFAAFSSSASNNGNTFGSGTLVLAIDGFGGSGSPAKFTVSEAKPGDVNVQVIDLSNVGSIGAGSVTLTGIGVTPAGPSLGDVLTLELFNDVDNSGTINGGDIAIGTAHLTDSGWTNLPLGFGLPASGHHKVIARLTFDSAANDSYQNQSVSFNFNFVANQ